MRKKTMWAAVGIAVLLICCVVYFRPMSLSDCIGADDRIVLSISTLSVPNGEAGIDTTDYSDITTEQQKSITSLLENCTYTRSLRTLLPQTSLSDIGGKTAALYVYHDDSLLHSIQITENGQFLLDNRIYKIKNAEQLLDQLTGILT